MRALETGQDLLRHGRVEQRGGEVGQSLFEFHPLLFSFMLLYKKIMP